MTRQRNSIWRSVTVFLLAIAATQITWLPAHAKKNIAHYEVTLPTQNDPVFHVQIDLSALTTNHPQAIFSRARQLNVTDQVFDIRCDDTPLTLGQTGRAVIPNQCSVLRWRSHLDNVEKTGLSFAQQSFRHQRDGWGMLSGPSSLLRLTMDTNGSEISIKTGDGDAFYRGPLAPLSRPPVFLPFGDWPNRLEIAPEFNILYHLDNSDILDDHFLASNHYTGLNYYSTLLQLTPPASPINVIWISHALENGSINGAAGDTSIVVNYPGNLSPNNERNRMRALYVLLHEQFHQLDPGSGRSAWQGESLASYFALKAMKQSLIGDPQFQEIWSIFINLDRPINLLLEEIEHQIAADDRTNYFSLYTQGATFWFQLDETIRKGTQGTKSLDTYALALMSTEGNEILQTLIKEIPSTLHHSVERLLQKYVLWNQVQE